MRCRLGFVKGANKLRESPARIAFEKGWYSGKVSRLASDAGIVVAELWKCQEMTQSLEPPPIATCRQQSTNPATMPSTEAKSSQL